MTVVVSLVNDQINVSLAGVGPQGATGPAGATGATGSTGQGVPIGGTTGQSLVKIDSSNYNTQWQTVGGGTVNSVGLSMPSGFTVASSPVTGSGTLAVTTSLSGMLKAAAGAFLAATAGTDYQAPINLTTTGTSGAATFVGNTLNIPQYAGATYTAGTGLTLSTGAFSVNTTQNITALSNLSSNGLIKTSGGTGTLSVASAGTDYSAGTSALGTGILKSTTGTGALSIAIASDFPTLNQSTTGNAATASALQTGRTINGTTFDGTANITITAAAGTLTGTTLASNVVSSSLTSAAGGSFGTAAYANTTAFDAAGAAATALASAEAFSANASNITSGTLGAARLPNPTAATLGGVQSYAAVSHQWINAISTSGVPSSSQPAFSDISGTVSSGQLSGSYTGITGVGTLAAGTWNASVISPSYGGTGATSLTGIVKGNGTSPFTAAVSGTDYQAPITLTTTGTSGAATFTSGTLNIPQYSGGGGSPGGSSGQMQYNNSGAFGGASFSAVASSGNLLTLTALHVGDTPLVSQAYSSGQTAALIRALDYAGNPIFEVGPSRSSNPVATFHCTTAGQQNVVLTDDAGNYANLGMSTGNFIVSTHNQLQLTGGLTGNGQQVLIQDGYGLATYNLGYIGNSSGTQTSHSLNAGVNQSGTASYIGYALNVTENSTGSGTKTHTQWQKGGSVLSQLDSKGNFLLGPGALTTSSTDGYPYIPTVAGVPTGTPTSKSGYAPIVYDSTDSRLYAYSGSWLQVGGGGSGSPGGSNTQIQYNNSGSFGGITGATTDGTNLLVNTQAATDSSTKAASTAFTAAAVSNAYYLAIAL